MTEAEIVHNFKLAEQEAYAKRLMLYAYSITWVFALLEVGKPCGNGPIAEFKTIEEVRKYLKDKA
jgi:hypothetical protein